MSLINKALHNLDHQREESLINRSSGSVDKRIKIKSHQNFLILIISLGIIVALFYITYHSQVNQYLKRLRSCGADYSAQLVANVLSLKNKFVVSDKPIIKNSMAEVKVFSPSVQAQYYNAMNLLNEGNAEQARKNLDQILLENPNFIPARQAISMLEP